MSKKRLVQKNKFDKKRFVWILGEQINEFFPYLLFFYVISLLLSLIFKSWRAYFYWPALHAVMVISALFLVGYFVCKRIDFAVLKNRLKEIKLLPIKIVFLHGIKGIGKIFSCASIFFFVKVIKNFKFEIVKLFKFIKRDFSRVYFQLKKIFRYFCDRLRKILNFIYHELSKLSKRDWLKIIFIALLLLFSLYKEIAFTDFLFLAFGSVAVLFSVDSRFAAGGAIICLAVCPFLIIFKKESAAEIWAIWAYYFLIISVLTAIRETNKQSVDNNVDKLA